eukprot:8201699-Pyramimonas_sp.AAC.1
MMRRAGIVSGPAFAPEGPPPDEHDHTCVKQQRAFEYESQHGLQFASHKGAGEGLLPRRVAQAPPYQIGKAQFVCRRSQWSVEQHHVGTHHLAYISGSRRRKSADKSTTL